MDTLSALIAEPSGLTITDETTTLDWAAFTSRVQAVAAQLRVAGLWRATVWGCGCRTPRITWR